MAPTVKEVTEELAIEQLRNCVWEMENEGKISPEDFDKLNEYLDGFSEWCKQTQ
mgnify:CR=1 FL=1